jgi:hypothetical protein
MKNNKGQVAIFIIVAIILVGGVIVYLIFFKTKSTGSINAPEFNAQEYIEQCVRDKVREGVDKSLPQGGLFAPSDYELYQGNKIPFVCKNINYYSSCIQQYPRYLVTLQRELHIYLEPHIEGCFESLKAELQRRNYEIHDDGNKDFVVVLQPNVIEVSMSRKISFMKDGAATEVNGFTSATNSPLYTLALTAQQVVSQETQFCYFETTGFNLLYPKTDIKRTTLSDYSRIYYIADKESEKQLNIATRGCAIPAGY